MEIHHLDSGVDKSGPAQLPAGTPSSAQLEHARALVAKVGPAGFLIGVSSALGVLLTMAELVAGQAPSGSVNKVVPSLVMLGVVVGCVVVLIRSCVQAGAGSARAAERGSTLALVLATTGFGVVVPALLINASASVVVVGLAGSVVLGAGFIAVWFMLHRVAPLLDAAERAAGIPPAGSSLRSVPGDVEEAVMSRPYPYVSPLPRAVKQAHLDRIIALYMHFGGWGILAIPGLLCTIVSIFTPRHGSGLWIADPSAAAVLLGIGLAILAVAGQRMAHAMRLSRRHMQLLQAYGIDVDAMGNNRSA